MSLLLISMVPALIIFGLTIWAVKKSIQNRKISKPIRPLHAGLMIAGLLLIDAILSFFVFVSAALSHSEKEKAMLPFYLAFIFLFVVILPVIGGYFLSKRPKDRDKKSTP